MVLKSQQKTHLQAMTDVKHALVRGHLVKGYRIERLIGGGGFSLVYLATDLESQQRAVVKEYMPTSQARRGEHGYVEPLSENSAVVFRQGIKRFFDEAAALARVHHPNIVRVTNFFRANNTVYMVMQHEQGKDLRWYIKKHGGGLSEKFIRTVFPPLLQGLQVLHDRQLLHLDVKPANIFLRPGGNPLLLDFGAAQEAIGRVQRATPNTLTIGFAPVEQHNKGELGTWTDMYAIGASMWACITGRAPPASTLRLVKDTYRPAARGFARRYSRQLLEAIDWCMQIDPKDRPQNVQALLDVFAQAPPPETTAEESGLLAWLPWFKRRAP